MGLFIPNPENLASNLQKVLAESGGDGLGSVGDAKFLEDNRGVVADDRRADAKVLGDVGAGPAL